MYRFSLVLLLSLLTSTILHCQSRKIRFGQVSDDQLSMSACPYDKEAGAVVLSDVTSAWFTINRNSGGFLIIQERHVRIKIFDNSGYTHADVRIPYYTGEDRDADISNISAHTIVPSRNGYDKVKVDKSSIYEEETTDYYNTVKFTFPKIDDGVIVEYKYRLTSSYFSNIKRWEFQSDIPVHYTYAYVKIPEIIDCSVSVIGHDADKVTVDRNTQMNHEYNILDNIYEFEASNLPALSWENYSTNIRDFTTKARFVFRSIQIPGQPIEVIAGSYEKFNETILESENFKQLDRNNNFLDEIVEKVPRKDSPDADVRAFADYVNNQARYVEEHTFYPNVSARESLKGDPSNGAAVNMLLVLLLKKAGYRCEPVMLGTRSYGKPHPYDPDFVDFNHLASLVTLDDEHSILLDATSHIKGGRPEIELFNSEGWVVSNVNGRKLNLLDYAEAKYIYRSQWTIKPGNESVITSNLLTNYLGLHSITEEAGYSHDQFQEWQKKKSNGDIHGLESSRKNNMIEISYDQTVDIPDQNIIYLTPDYLNSINFDHFRNEIRNVPLDIPYRMSGTNLIEIIIPEGFVVESLPDSRKFSLANDGMRVAAVYRQAANKIMINLRLHVDETFILQNRYPEIRAFVGHLETLVNEKIVLKKKE